MQMNDAMAWDGIFPSPGDTIVHRHIRTDKADTAKRGILKRICLFLAIFFLVLAIAPATAVYASDDAGDWKTEFEENDDSSGIKKTVHDMIVLSFQTIDGPLEAMVSATNDFNLGNGVSEAFLNGMKSLAYVLVTYYFLSAMFESAVSERMSYEIIMKNFLHLVLALVLVNLSGEICEALWRIGNAVSAAIQNMTLFGSESTVSAAYKQAVEDYDDITGPLSLFASMGMIISYAVSYVIGILCTIAICFVLIGRVLEFTVRMAFSPFALADITKNGLGGNGIRYMKKLLSISLQLAAIQVIAKATPLAISWADNAFSDMGAVGWLLMRLAPSIVNIAAVGLATKSQGIMDDVVGAR